MDFQAACIIRKPFAWILFFDIIGEILTASFEYFMLKGNSISFLLLWNKLSYFGGINLEQPVVWWRWRALGGRNHFLSETRKNTRWLSKSDDVISVFEELNFDRYSPSFRVARNKNDMKYDGTRHFLPTKQVRDYLKEFDQKGFSVFTGFMI